MDSIKDYWRTWLWKDTTTRIITVNTLVWIIIGIGSLFINNHNWWIGLFGMPASLSELPLRFWTPILSMFSQYDFMHLLVNMLWMLLFGKLLEHAAGSNFLLSTYIISGLAGALAFLVTEAIGGESVSMLIGSSCAVIGIAGACAMLAPKWKINLLIFGYVQVIWISLGAILLFVLIQPTLYISIAHAGGLIAGIICGYAYKKNWHSKIVLSMRNSEAHRNTYSPNLNRGIKNGSQTETEMELDSLLDKVNQSGYSSLSSNERQRLFMLSRKLKNN